MAGRRKLFSAIVTSVFVVAGVAALSGQPAGPLQGVWRVTEIRLVRAGDTLVVSDPQPGLFIFTKTHYSATWVPQAEPRQAFASPFEPTREELATACDSLIVNSGTYTVVGSELTVRPVVTRMPEFSGGTMILRYRVNGTQLSLEVIDESSRNGIQAPWIRRQRLALTLQRVE